MSKTTDCTAQYELTCACGNTFPSKKTRGYCDKCGRKAFADPLERRKYKLHHYYIYAILIGILLFVGYMYGELIARPLLSF